MVKRRQLLLGGLAVAGGSALALPAWTAIEADSLVLETVRVPIRGLDRPLKVAQLSDIHWDRVNVPWKSVERAVEMVNEANVDIVALTGDFVSKSTDPIFELAPALGRLRAREGVFAVLGNHDNALAHSRRTITRALEQHQVQVLQNAWTEVAGLAVGGTGDLWHGPFEPERVLVPLRGRRPTLLLSHNPDGFYRLGDYRVDLQLSGHTHGGQVRLPGIGPVLGLKNRLRGKLDRYMPEFAEVLPDGSVIQSGSWAGLYKKGTNQLYVNRGMGRFKRLSIGCPPEVTIAQLVPA